MTTCGERVPLRYLILSLLLAVGGTVLLLDEIGMANVLTEAEKCIKIDTSESSSTANDLVDSSLPGRASHVSLSMGNFMEQYRLHAKVCTQETNRVLPRYDSIGLDRDVNRLWSVHSSTYDNQIPALKYRKILDAPVSFDGCLQSSQYSGETICEKAIDEIISPALIDGSMTALSKNPWWMGHLSHPAYVSHILIYKDCCNSLEGFKVWIGNNPSTYSGDGNYECVDLSPVSKSDVIATDDSKSDTNLMIKIVCPASIPSASLVWLTIPGENQAIALAEIQVFQRNDTSLLTSNGDKELPFCQDTHILLNSLRGGIRVPANDVIRNIAFVDSFRDTSSFVPYGCSYHWFSPDEACEVISEFARVYYLGDSLMRHTTQALVNVLSGDWSYGGLPRLSKLAELTDKCKCDGQFSEALVCRTYANDHMFNMLDPHDYGICSGIIRPFQFFFFGDVNKPWRQYRCEVSASDDRPILIHANFGYHIGVDPDALLGDSGPLPSLLNAIYTDPQVWAPCDHGKKPAEVRFIWSALSRQVEALDSKYPHQRAAFVKRFNTRVSEYLDAFSKQHNLDLPILDLFTLSSHAPSPDGLHVLQDSNLIRNQYVLNWIALSQHRTIAE